MRGWIMIMRRGEPVLKLVIGNTFILKSLLLIIILEVETRLFARKECKYLFLFYSLLAR